MAAPSTPTNFYVQAGDGQVYLSWDITSGATSYQVQRSTDGVTFTNLAAPSANNYFDTTVTPSTEYYYQVAAVNGSGTSAYTAAQSIVPTITGLVSLAELRLEAQQRADMVNSNFLTLPEWNLNITKSYKWLYNLLIQKYGEDYYYSVPYSFVTTGTVDATYQAQVFPLPDGQTVTDSFTDNVVPAFYKEFLTEVALNPGDPNSWVTLRKYQRIQQNLWNYPNVYTFYGITNLRYRLTGTQIQIVPIASAGQTIRMWYAPRPKVLMADTDTIDGVAGWEELIPIHAAIKALAKEESDTSELQLELNAKILEIENSAANRDVGEPEKVSDGKLRNFAWTEDGSIDGGGMW